MIIMIFHGRIHDWCLNLIFVVNSSNQAIVSYRHLECFATSPLWSYSGYFGTHKNFKIPNSGQENSMLNQLTYSTPLRLLLTFECLSNNELGKIWCDFLVTFQTILQCNLTWSFLIYIYVCGCVCIYIYIYLIYSFIENKKLCVQKNVLTELHKV